jgi:hypothetical protein
MPRVYRTKGERALNVKLSVPLTVRDMERLEQRATAERVGKTEYARRVLLEHLT